MRIINIVENLDKGAVENWLVNIFLASRQMRPDWQWTFYCILGKEGRLDSSVREAGGEIIYSPVTVSEKLGFLRHLRSTLKVGRYDVIHAHHDYLSGFYLLASVGIKFRKRILHIHNNDRGLPVGNKLLHYVLLRPFRVTGLALSDTVIGISKNTLLEFAGRKAANEAKYKILYYGIDLRAFKGKSDPGQIKQAINLPADSQILLFTGRMNEFKNPVFLVEILKEALKTRENLYAIFAGKGDLEKDVLEKAAELGITNHIRMLGWRDDTATLMKSADVFVFPRLEYPKEGLGLVVVEAQAAGLPMVLSYGIVEDAVVVKELAHFVAFNNNPVEWAEEILKIVSNTPAISKDRAFELVEHSNFELKKGTQNLLDIYESN